MGRIPVIPHFFATNHHDDTMDTEKFGQTDTRLEPTDDHQESQVVYYVDGQRRVYVPGSKEERRMVWKIDLHMFSCICTLYLLNCEFESSRF